MLVCKELIVGCNEVCRVSQLASKVFSFFAVAHMHSELLAVVEVKAGLPEAIE